MLIVLISAFAVALLAVFAGGAFLIATGGSDRYQQVQNTKGKVVGLVDRQLDEPRPKKPIDLNDYQLVRRQGARLDAPRRRRWVPIPIRR